jgi:murein peptide amidase A
MCLKTLVTIFLISSVGIAAPAISEQPQQSDIQQWCKDLSKELMSVKYDSCTSREWKVGDHTTTGRPIPYLFWGSSNSESRRVLILGAMHGDEISSVSMVFRWLDFLEKTKPDSFLRESKYLFFPLVNPDGFYSNPRTRTNLAGVDLNRNFETSKWSEEATLYWQKKTHKDPRRFPGKSAASENETKLIQKWINDFKPELIISVHAPYGLIDHDGPIQFSRNERGPLPVKTLGAFPGSLGKYAGLERNIPVVTIELEAAKKIPEIKTVEDILVFVMKAKY